jgi:hypothetical protein
MKKFALIISILLLSTQIFAAEKIDATTNLALTKNAFGTFSDPTVVTDGKLRGNFAQSGNTSDAPQFLTIDLGTNMYLDRVKIYWDKAALSNGFIVRTSADAKVWQEEASDLDAADGVLDNNTGTVAISISLKRAVINTRYLQIMVPSSSKVTNPKGTFVRISEVEIYPSLSQTFILNSLDVYAVTGTTAFMKFNTSVGAASGTISYGLEPGKMDKVAINTEAGVDNSVTITSLKPATTYFYQLKAVDYFGNTVTSKVQTFTTIGENVALKKKVTGTFTALPPKDKYVQSGNADEVLARVTDGGTSYFTSMATSGSIYNADQFVIIDLGRNYNLKTILSYWRRLVYPEALIIQLSSDGNSWNTVADGVNVNDGNFARSDAGDPMKVLAVKAAPARYVKLLVKKDSAFYHKHSDWDFVQLMEVQAFE